MRAPWSKVPALPIVVGLATGIAIARYAPALLWITIATTIIAAYLWLRKIHWVSVATFFVSCGIIMGMLRLPQSLPEYLVDKPVTLIGRVEASAEDEGGTRYSLRGCKVSTDSVKTLTDITHSGVILRVYNPQSKYRLGDVLMVHGRLADLREEEDVPMRSDYSAYSYCNNLTAKISARPSEVRLLHNNVGAVEGFIDNTRSELEHIIVNSGFDGATASFILATIAGDTALLSQENRDIFRASGTAHILAISGLHIGIIVGMLTLLLLPIRLLPRGRNLYYILLMAAVAIYAAIVGMQAPVARAMVMFEVFGLSRLLQRSTSPYNSLCVSVALWLLINPAWLWSPGLQLSVAAVLAIVWAMSKLKKASAAVRYCAVPIAAICGTSMLTIFYFHSFPTLFLPVNIIAGILTPIIMIGAALCTILGAIGIDSGFLPDAVNVVYGTYYTVTEWFAGLPWAQISNIYPSAIEILLYLMVLSTAIMAIEKIRWWRTATVVSIGTLAILVVSLTQRPDYGHELYVARSQRSTDLIISSGGRVMAISDGGEDALSKIQTLYRNFAGSRGADTIASAPEKLALPGISRNRNLVTFDDKKIVILSNTPYPIPGGKADYLLVGKGYNGNIIDIANGLECDSILLAASLGRKTIDKLSSTLDRAGIAYKRLDKEKFGLRSKN